jgi:hypothetical protein
MSVSLARLPYVLCMALVLTLLASSFPRIARAQTPQPATWGDRDTPVGRALIEIGVVPIQCYDSGLRFPGATNPRSAVTQAMRQTGRNPHIRNPFIQMLLDNSPQIVAGWVATSLILEWSGYPPITLADWINMGQSLGFHLSAAEWSAMLAWPTTTCEGAFVQHPANLDIMRLVDTYAG